MCRNWWLRSRPQRPVSILCFINLIPASGGKSESQFPPSHLGQIGATCSPLSPQALTSGGWERILRRSQVATAKWGHRFWRLKNSKCLRAVSRTWSWLCWKAEVTSPRTNVGRPHPAPFFCWFPYGSFITTRNVSVIQSPSPKEK